jgi:phosphatidylserine decarboxylase
MNIVTWPFTWKKGSAIMPLFTESRLSKPFVPLYARVYGVNVSEADAEIADYETISALFCRRLKPGARKINDEESCIVSPVDGKVLAKGRLKCDTLITVKGEKFSLEAILRSSKKATLYRGGLYVLLYMAPGGYHHMHAPFDAKITAVQQIAGRNFPLHDLALHSIPGLYSRNYRQLVHLERIKGRSALQGGKAVMVQVAATFVGSIQNHFDENSLNNGSLELAKGEEMSYFTFGSSVLLIFSPNEVRFTSKLKVGNSVNMGEKIANFID